MDLHRITLIKPADFELEYALMSFNVVEFSCVFKSSDDSAVVLAKPEPSIIEYSASSDLTEDSEQFTIHDGPVTRPSSSSSISDKLPKPQQLVTIPGAVQPFSKRSSTWNPNRGIVLLNVNDERIDADLGKPDQEAERNLKKRAEITRLCNDFHLRGVCFNPPCQFSHEPKLDLKELIVLRYWARRLPCLKGSACRSAECWYGHMCPREPCFMPNTCRFKGVHGMDRTAVTVWQISGPSTWVPPPESKTDRRGVNTLSSDDSLRL